METDSTNTGVTEFLIPEEKVFHLEEHQRFKDKDLPFITSLNLPFKETEYEAEPRYLGITPNFTASYYIGADWLTKDRAVVVTPKMGNIDFITMFVSALKFAPSAKYFTKFYGINFSMPKIESAKLNDVVTPLLLIHFLKSVKILISNGLKKGYVNRDENLQSKIKGRIMISRHISFNLAVGKQDKVMCSYQEFSIDIPENRIIKKALLVTKTIIDSMHSLQMHKKYSEISKMLSSALISFVDVSNDISVNSIHNISKNKLYGNYCEAIQLAKQILKHYDFSLSKSKQDTNFVLPFWIDMSRLYEVYVYSLLVAAYSEQIKFQITGHYNTAVDFLKLDEKLIMDTKYKPQYEKSNNGIIDDIRQISGYARDTYILQKLGMEKYNQIPKCLIIYPIEDNECHTVDTFFADTPILDKSKPIDGFKEFYKICVPMPKLSPTT